MYGAFEVRYSHNNSGGRDWLDKEDWAKLEAAGWKLESYGDKRTHSAVRTGLPLPIAIAEWEYILNMSSTDEGCECCGPPHDFYEL